MEPSIALRILSVLSQSEIGELSDNLLIKSKNIESRTTLSEMAHLNNSENKSAIAFSYRSKRLQLELGIFAVAKYSGISLPRFAKLKRVEVIMLTFC